jgi:D-xylose transport system permease protein
VAVTEAPATQGVTGDRPAAPTGGSLLAKLEIDGRMVGMTGALAIIWFAFNYMSNGNFLTPRNLWNLSVQSSAIAILATGMVLIIVSRNIDLSLGSLLGFLGYVMAMVQAIWIPTTLGLGYDQPYTWLLALAIGMVLGALVGALQGFVVAYGGVPSFIVTLGGFLVWRGLIFRFDQGQTIAPMDKTFQIIGGAPGVGSAGEVASWVIGIVACVAIVFTILSGRRRRRAYGFPVRPVWALIVVLVAGCGAVLVGVWVANHYYLPAALATQYAKDHGITEPPGGLLIPVGISWPVLIMIGVTLVMTIIATRRRFGRYVFAIGGNPDAAELGGINVKRTIVGTFAVMGILCAISGAFLTARLNSAVTGLGVQSELYAIAAAVIGGTSFSGGIGTIPGAVLGAVVMQSLQSGMAIVGVDSPTQDVVVGIVLVGAVFLDVAIRRRTAR